MPVLMIRKCLSYSSHTRTCTHAPRTHMYSDVKEHPICSQPGKGRGRRKTNQQEVATNPLHLNANRFFFHYSGHGGQAKDEDGDEDDGHDETIYPVDHEEAGVIVDDEMHAILVHPLPAGCRLTAIMDCCHSGSALDLPYIYSTTGNLKEPNMMADVGQGVLFAGMAYLKGDTGGMLRGLGDLGKKLMTSRSNRDKSLDNKSSPADCIMLSG